MARVSDVIAELMDILATEGDVKIYLQDGKAQLSAFKLADLCTGTVSNRGKYETAALLHVELE